ncbi:MAG: hypothetical protein ACM3N5_06725, partial [Candidatus Eiseniibacteriota bacterium]
MSVARGPGAAATVPLGDFTIARVSDLDSLEFPGYHVFPDYAAEAMEAQADWLVPRYVDATSRKLLLAFQGFLVKTPRHTILVDSCIGNDKERPNRPFWHR